jgi:hypothetical protein
MHRATTFSVNGNGSDFKQLSANGVRGETAFVRIYAAAAVNIILDAVDAADAATKNGSLTDLFIFGGGTAGAISTIGSVNPARCWIRANGASATTVSLLVGN